MPLPVIPFRRTRFTGLTLLASASAVLAQTNGTLSTATSVNYSTAPWTITSGTDPYPTNGGVATFTEPTAVTLLTTAGFPAPAVVVDVPVTLSGLTFSSYSSYAISAGTNGALNLSTTGTNTIDVPFSSLSTPTTPAVGATITAPIGGGGTYGLTKTSAGVVTLSGTNTYTGGTFINGGTLNITTGDVALGATGTGNDVALNGGTLRVSNTALTSARNLSLGSGGGTLQLTAAAAAALSGVISGAGNLIQNGGTLTLAGANTYTGTTTTQTGSTLTVSGAGSINASTGYDFAGTVTLDSSGTNVTDRISDTAAITARVLNLTLTGNASATTTERVGTVTLTGGFDALTVAPGTGQAAGLNTAGLTRQNNALLFVRGTGLGGAAGTANVATITSAAAPALVGGGGATSTSASIVPWALGNVSTAAFSTTSNANSSFVTYDATNGFRPLATTEYASTLTTSTAVANNVRLVGSPTIASGSTCNALLYQPTSSGGTLAGGTINVTSGAFLYSPQGNGTSTVSAALNFGAAEGVVINTSKLNLSSAISGSGGLTLGSPSATGTGTSIVTLTGASTYTGNTTLTSGTVAYSGTVGSNGTASAFGANGDVVLNGGLNIAFLQATAASVFNRNISVLGKGTNYIGTAGSGYTDTIAGNVSLTNNVYTYGGANAAASAILFNGTISGAGGINDTGLGYVVLNGNNTYGGGTLIGSGSNGSTFVAGTDTAFGTGTIYFNAAAATSTLSGGTQTRTLANNLFLGATANAFAGSAALTVNGGVNLNGRATVNISNTSGAGVTFGGVVADGGIYKTGAGTLTLVGNNTYAGGTYLAAASNVFVNNTAGSGTGLGAVNVATSGSLLGGTGTVAGAVTVASGGLLQGGANGVVSAGGSSATGVGSLTLNSDLTMATGSIIQLFLGADGSHGTLARGGGTWNLAANQAFSLPGAAAGVFYDNILTGLAADPGTEGGWTFTSAGMTGTFTYDGGNGPGNIDLTLTAVPEPATVLGGLLTVGALGWGMRRRRKANAEVRMQKSEKQRAGGERQKVAVCGGW